MTVAIQTPKTPAAQTVAAKDLSAAIEQSMERERDEEVVCVRLFGHNYRCNWWVRGKSSQAWFLTSGRIRRSKFLRATLADEKLLIEDLSIQH